MFGEEIPREIRLKAQETIRYCDLLLLIGTSANVSPVNEIPMEAKRNGARIIEINLEKTPLSETATDLFLEGDASQILTSIFQQVVLLLELFFFSPLQIKNLQKQKKRRK